MSDLRRLLDEEPTESELAIVVSISEMTEDGSSSKEIEEDGGALLTAHRVKVARAVVEGILSLNCAYCNNGLPRVVVKDSKSTDDGYQWTNFYVHHGWDDALKANIQCRSNRGWEALIDHDSQLTAQRSPDAGEEGEGTSGGG